MIPADAVYGGILPPMERRCRPGRAALALSRRFVEAGGRLETRTPVTGLRARANGSPGVETPQGSLHAERVIVAAGAWTNALLATIDVRLPVRAAGRVPRRHRAARRTRLDADHHDRRGSHVPAGVRRRAALGHALPRRSTLPFVEEAVPERFDQLPLDGLAEAEANAAKAFDVFPSLAASRSRTVAFGAPTFTPDQRPCLGPVDAVQGLYVATGCNEAGVTHAPGYGRLLAELFTRGTTELCPIDTFAPDRFGAAYRGPVCRRGAPTHASRRSSRVCSHRNAIVIADLDVRIDPRSHSRDRPKQRCKMATRGTRSRFRRAIWANHALCRNACNHSLWSMWASASISRSVRSARMGSVGTGSDLDGVAREDMAFLRALLLHLAPPDSPAEIADAAGLSTFVAATAAESLLRSGAVSRGRSVWESWLSPTFSSTRCSVRLPRGLQ